MFCELATFSKKIFFLREKFTFVAWVSPKKIENSPGTPCTLYTVMYELVYLIQLLCTANASSLLVLPLTPEPVQFH